MIIRIAGIAVLAALAACTESQTAVRPNAPAMAPTAAGSGSAPLDQAARGIAGANCPEARAGTATVVGSTGEGCPAVAYSGPGGDAGTQVTRDPRTAMPYRGRTN